MRHGTIKVVAHAVTPPHSMCSTVDPHTHRHHTQPHHALHCTSFLRHRKFTTQTLSRFLLLVAGCPVLVPHCRSACCLTNIAGMTDNESDDVINMQALTQHVDVSPMQADIDSMQHDDDDPKLDDDNDSGTAPALTEQAADDDGELDATNDTANEEVELNDSTEQSLAVADHAPALSSATAAADGKLKRPPSAYFLFCADKRAEVKVELTGLSVTAVAKALGERWKQLTAEQKQQYEQTAREAKASYNEQQQRQQSERPTASATELPIDPLALVLPLSHIKRILHKDPAHARLTKQAALALSFAVQLFVLDLSKRCWLRVRGGKRRVVRMEEVLAVVEGGAGLEWLRGEMRWMARDAEKRRDADKKKREEERERNKENDPSAVNGADTQQHTASNTKSSEETEDAGAKADAPDEVEQAGKKKRKAGKAEIDPKQYKSLTSMFSRMHEVQQEKKQQQQSARHRVVEEEQSDEIKAIEADDVDDDNDDVQVDKRQKTVQQIQLGVEVVSDVEEVQREHQGNQVEAEAETDDLEAVILSHRAKRRTAILDDEDDIADL